jgi:pimeloyl-ACP methyl ester carboxylesterase
MNKKIKIITGSIAIVALLIVGYFWLDNILFDGVKPKYISENGFSTTLFSNKNTENRPTIVLIGGGHWGDYWGQEFAKSNYVGLSLPYYREEGLPHLMEEIPLEYFEKAILWLKEQPEVNPNKIIVMGASRNAELALLIASFFPNHIHGVIAYSPSSVSWSNTVLPFNSDSVKPSWTLNTKPIPYIAMDKIKGTSTSTIETLKYWKNGLSDSVAVNNASIKVENINGPILLFSGVEDEVWPSSIMSDMIENRIKMNHFNFDFENIKYENAGHLISSNPNNPSTMRQGKMEIEGKSYDFNFGGTENGDMVAQKNSAERVLGFVSKLEND